MRKIKAYRHIALITFLCISINVRSQGIEVTLGTPTQVLNYGGVPIFQWFPDGHISMVREIETDQYAMYWAGHKSYRSLGQYQFPEFQLTLAPADEILGGKTDVDAWDNGGSWLMSVFRVDGDTLVGFYHAEDHYYGTDNPGNIAWKSLARVVSYDNGMSWEQPERIIISNEPKPEIPTWGGAGDNSVIWDEVNKRWLCYYQEHYIMLAMSGDPLGRPGTWYKYYEGSFSQPGMGGLSSQVNGLTIAGGNPSVHFNSYLNKYVITYHGWNRSIYLSTSANGIDWEVPANIIAPSGQRRVWYPTIIGETDVSAGKVARIYYADMSPDLSDRNFVSRAIIFDEDVTFKPNNWMYEKIGNFSMKGSYDSLGSGAYRITAFEGSLGESVTYGYHYQDVEGSFEASFRLSLNEDMPGPVGCAIRAGVKDTDEELLFFFNGSDILSGDGTGLAGGISGDTVAVSVKKINDALTISYRDENGNWSLIQSATWNDPSCLLGFFSIGSPDQPSMGYVSDLILEPVIPVGIDRIETDKLIVYPNPITNNIYIEGSESVQRVVLMNFEGRILYDMTACDRLAGDKLSKGVYVLKILRTNGQVEYHKVMIER